MPNFSITSLSNVSCCPCQLPNCIGKLTNETCSGFTSSRLSKSCVIIAPIIISTIVAIKGFMEAWNILLPRCPPSGIVTTPNTFANETCLVVNHSKLQISKNSIKAQAMKIIQPSKSCRNPSAIEIPQLSTNTPIAPIRKLFIKIVTGIVAKKTRARFQKAA